MKELIKVIAFDADDTLWSNEPFFQEVEKQYTDLLKPYGTSKEISAALFQTEMNNLQILGYGAKAFTISMVETALQISNGKIAADIIRQIVDLGKSLLKMPIELLPGVKETLKTLKETGKYKLVVATKGDLLARDIVDISNPVRSATSFSIIGLRVLSSPVRKNSFCKSIITCIVCNRVCCLCLTASTNHWAASSFCFTKSRASLRSRV